MSIKTDRFTSRAPRPSVTGTDPPSLPQLGLEVESVVLGPGLEQQAVLNPVESDEVEANGFSCATSMSPLPMETRGHELTFSHLLMDCGFQVRNSLKQILIAFEQDGTIDWLIRSRQVNPPRGMGQGVLGSAIPTRDRLDMASDDAFAVLHVRLSSPAEQPTQGNQDLE